MSKNKGMISFRGFSDFNKALLGKHCWRLMIGEWGKFSKFDMGGENR